jgi:hypothetical protein
MLVLPSAIMALLVPHTESEYDRLVTRLDALIDHVGEDETHHIWIWHGCTALSYTYRTWAVERGPDCRRVCSTGLIGAHDPYDSHWCGLSHGAEFTRSVWSAAASPRCR